MASQVPLQTSANGFYPAQRVNISPSPRNRLGLFSSLIRAPEPDLGCYSPNLPCEISQDGSTIKSLSRAFDLGAGLTKELTKPTSGANASLYASPTDSALCETSGMDVFGIPPMKTRPEHPFLSTPIRLKEFPRLSPDTLRYLLRSPPPWLPESDPSYDVPAELSLAPTGQSPDRKHKDGAAGYPFYPLTPPPTVVLPPSEILPAVDPRSLSENLVTESPPRPTCDPFTTNSTYHAGISSARHALRVPELEQDVNAAGTGHAFGNRGSLVSPRVLRKFRTVINELQGVNDTPHDNRGIYATVFPPPPLFNSVRRQTSEADSFEAGFVAQLLHKALHEEAKAGELRTMAVRLETLAQRRRAFAKYMEQQG